MHERVATSDDPVTSYAQAVCDGELIAGPHVRDACRRHIGDLNSGAARGLRWDLSAAHRAFGFFSRVLRLNGGEWEGRPYRLLSWQAFVVGSLMGWKARDGARRFRVAFVETGKGSGKSPLAAGIGLYGLVADGEARAEVYAAAPKKDQAMILFRDAVAMVEQSPALARRLAKSGVGERTWNLAYRATGSWFRPISADDRQSGPRPHVSLLDEIHEHNDALIVEMLRAGQKGRRQPLMFMITNSGVSKTSVCWTYHDYAVKVASGAIEDDSFFSYVCALDDGDDPLADESCWPKANPSLVESDIPGTRYLREQVAQARAMPARESIVRRLNFCQWVDAENPAIPRHVWEGAEDRDFDPSLLRGRRCWGGLDLSSTRALTAFALIFEPVPDDPRWRLISRFWLPGDDLPSRADHDRAPYLLWRDRGWLIAPSGRVIDYRAVARQCAADCAQYDVQGIAYDRWRIAEMQRSCADDGISLPLVECGQGFRDMSPAVDAFEALLFGGELRHDGNPLMTWCMANLAYETDAAGNRKPSKDHATGHIDGAVAAIMAAGRATAEQQAAANPWNEREPVFV